MGAFLSAIGQVCSLRRGPTIQEIQEAADAKVRALEEQLLQSQSALAELKGELEESRQSHIAKQRLWKEETTSLQSKLAAATQELQDSVEVLSGLRLCIETANAPIVAVDSSGYIQDWNSKATEVFGFAGSTSLRRKMADSFHKEDRSGFLELEANVMSAPASDVRKGHLQRHFRVRSRGSGEPWHEVLICASPRHRAEGTLEGALYIGHDLTQSSRERLEAELAVQDLKKLIRTVNAPIIGVDEHGCVDEWNVKAERLTGFSREEALGKVFLKHFITEDFKDSVQEMLSKGMGGQEITNFEFSLFTKGGQRREILFSATARRNRKNEVVGVIGVGQDITELRSESKMLANYVRICGAAVWSLRGNAMTGAVTDSKTKEIEHLISQQAQMDIWDPRMVLWRASFVSILKTMCQNYWVRRKGSQGPTEKVGRSSTEITADFVYEFSFEAPNGSVKWYRVQGHLIQECLIDSQFEVTGSMQEVTSMLIDKVMGDRWQKWWNRMCHMVFDATLLVDTQEYRVLNAWGEEKVFGCKLQSNHPLLQLIKHEDTVSLKEAFNEVTFKGFERGRTLHLQRPGSDKDMPAQCFLLSADQENPNECMMGIRMQVSGPTDDDVSVLWDVAKPNPVLTLEDLARLKSGLKRSHRRPSRNVRISRSAVSYQHRTRSSDPHASSHSLSSIPEDLHGEFEEDDLRSVSDRGSEAADSLAEDTENESLQSSSKSSNSSNNSNGSISEVGVCNSSPARSASEEHSNSNAPREGPGGSLGEWSNPFALSPKLQPRTDRRNSSPPRPKARPGKPAVPVARKGPAKVTLKWCKQTFNINLDDFSTIQELRTQVQELTGVPPGRQTLIFSGRRLPPNDESLGPGDQTWNELKASVRPGQALMLIGSAPSADAQPCPAAPGSSGGAGTQATCPEPAAGAEGSAPSAEAPCAAEAELSPPANVEALDD